MLSISRIALAAWAAGALLTHAGAFAASPPNASAAIKPEVAVAAPAPAVTAGVPLNAAASAEFRKSGSTADHSKFKELDKEFKSGPEVTKACLSCHNQAAKQVQHTKHWTWSVVNPETKQVLGKKNVINNYCTSPISNEKDCMACHVGYGWKDGNFDFSAEENVDCLVCHDTTATYRKLSGDAGHPVYERKEFPPHSGKFIEAADLKKIAQSIGKSSRSTCGACHFYGAGGDGTKHGDLSSALKKPGKYLDVHMNAEGLNFTCTKCHQTSGHQVAGSRYQLPAAEKGAAHIRGKADAAPETCQACHSNTPHKGRLSLLNDHTSKVACQTCHIPAFARDSIGTEMSWDWSTATKMGPDGKQLVTKDSAGRRAFDSKKGTFVWDSYVTPEYIWFNGKFDYKVVGDKIDPTQVVLINKPGGSPAAEDSRIWPMKVHTGKQAYDKVNNTLIVAHTAGEDDTALWHNFDWQKAIGTGMKAAGLPYSGEYGFVSTEMRWPIAHMVAPKGDALTCIQCHSPQGRMKNITGVYLPGRDAKPWFDWAALIITGLMLLGVLAHGGIRYLSRTKGA